jgi:hypothetical protein
MNQNVFIGIASTLLILIQYPSIARSFFVVPPTEVAIHNPKSTEGERNRTTITVSVPADAENTLAKIILTQLPNIDQWDWGELKPEVYFGQYSIRARGKKGLAIASLSKSGDVLEIALTPAVEPGKTINVVFTGFNPDSNIYQWKTEFLASGDEPVRYLGPTLRVNIYDIDPFH